MSALGYEQTLPTGKQKAPDAPGLSFLAVKIN
jgi:hypothetical protein